MNLRELGLISQFMPLREKRNPQVIASGSSSWRVEAFGKFLCLDDHYFDGQISNWIKKRMESSSSPPEEDYLEVPFLLPDGSEELLVLYIVPDGDKYKLALMNYRIHTSKQFSGKSKAYEAQMESKSYKPCFRLRNGVGVPAVIPRLEHASPPAFTVGWTALSCFADAVRVGHSDYRLYIDRGVQPRIFCGSCEDSFPNIQVTNDPNHPTFFVGDATDPNLEKVLTYAWYRDPEQWD